MISSPPAPAILQNIGIFELLCIGSVVLITFVVVGLIVFLVAIRSRRRDCPHCGASHPRSVSVCSKCGKTIA
jgi:hypothetical protein